MSEHSPHYWGFATQKKWDDWRDAVSRQYRDEFYLDLANYLRGRPHTIKPGTEGETMAKIAAADRIKWTWKPVDVKQHNWMSLSEACKQLQKKFRGHHSLLDELLSNAIASGLVLIRGVPQFETLPVMIDGRSVKSPTRCNIRRGTLDLKSGYAARRSVDYHFVEIAWLEVDQYIHACALPSVPTPRPSEAAVRHAFGAIVEQYGRKNILKRGELDKELRDRVPGVTSKQCRDVRFWAIDQGILPAIATRPGRPRKSLRKGC